MESPHKGKTGLRRLWNALNYSADGLKAAYASEAAFRQELVLAAVLMPLAFLMDVAPVERAVLIASIFFVMIVELLNSALEAVVDRVSLENHHLSKRAKDIGSAAVLLALMTLAVVWACILLPRFGLI
ncbi:MAG: diacylglycerol kinase [Rhodocyclaceae bacterium]|nr:diacylglycerol kinase [Rhodocyclaceae bacterium]